MFFVKGLRERSKARYGAAFFVCGLEHDLYNLAREGTFWIAKQGIYLMRVVSTKADFGSSYHSTHPTRPLELAEKRRLNRALTVIVNIVGLENLVESFV